MTHGLGLIYSPAIEAAAASQLTAMTRAPAPVSEEEMPQRIDRRGVIPINDQGPYGSCDGNSVDTCCQNDEYIATGKVINTSARFAYLVARMKDAELEGRQLTREDGGASISGGILAARDYGAVLESDFPYWEFDWQTGHAEPFTIDIPSEVMEKAKGHRVQSITPVMWTWEEMLPLIATNQASFSFGMYWTGAMSSYRGDGPIINYRGGGGGGHALAVYEYEWVNGERWPRIRNSHGNWGDRGTAVIRPDVFNYMLKCAPWGARGMSKMPNFTKRELKTWEGMWQ